MTINEILKNAITNLENNQVEDSKIKAKILLANLLDKPKEYIYIHEENELDKESVEKYNQQIEQLINGKSLQYITNKQEFYGIELYVNKNVLIPRADTEILVEEVLKTVKEGNKILDLCAGSGAIGIAIAKNIKNAKVECVDISEKAIEVVKINALKNDVDIQITKSNMFENINNKYDIIVSNPPYIETDVIKTLSHDVQNEPNLALDGGTDGLDFYRIIAIEGEKYLKENGQIYLEIGYNQKQSVTEIFEKQGYKNIECTKDLSGQDRVIIVR